MAYMRTFILAQEKIYNFLASNFLTYPKKSPLKLTLNKASLRYYELGINKDLGNLYPSARENL